MSVCRQCHREIPEITESSFCPYCGAALREEGLFEFNAESAPEPEHSAPEPKPYEQRPQPEVPSSSPAHYVHWEDRARLGFLRALSQTWSDSSFRPTEFFRRAPRQGNIGSALLYAVLLGVSSTLLSLFWQYYTWESFSESMAEFEDVVGMTFDREVLGFIALAMPFLVVMAIFITSAIYHLCLLIVGSGKSGWEATFRAVCYSYGPQLFVLIPFCGGFIAFFWQFALMIIGWREFHQSSTAKAFFAALLPLLVCCGGVLILIFSFASMLSRFNMPF